MFFSKIWLFLVGAFALVVLAVAIALPKPAHRTATARQDRALRRACSVANIILRDNARWRVQLAGQLARADAPAGAPKLRLDTILLAASKDDTVSTQAHESAKRALAEYTFAGTAPDFVILLDARGRVVAQSGYSGDNIAGRSLRGIPVIDDALRGYLRDDLWLENGTLYRVAASPVVTQRREWAGAVVIGNTIDKELAESFAQKLEVAIAFYAAGQPVAANSPVQIHDAVLAELSAVPQRSGAQDLEAGCYENEIFTITSGDKRYAGVISRLPGEAGEADGFFTVFIERDVAGGLFAAIGALKKDDFSDFPWLMLSLGLILVVGGGLALLIFEVDKPVRKLAGDAVKLAQDETERLDETAHRGKHGSIARSINIAVDKLRRDTRAARRDLDQLLGPAPDASGAAPATESLPGAVAPAPAAPPPSQFRFSDGSAPSPSPAAPPPAPAPAMSAPEGPVPPPPIALPPKVPGKAGDRTPPPIPTARPPSIADTAGEEILAAGAAAQGDDGDFDGPTRVANPSKSLLDAAGAGAMESGAQAAPDQDQDEAHYRQVFDEFIALKKQCGENTSSLTFSRFAGKLRTNRDALMAKHGCQKVRFQVYLKDGKAALKASPIKA